MSDFVTTNGQTTTPKVGTNAVKQGLAMMLKGGVIMDVMNVEQAKVAEAAGAVAVMALERIPADIRRDGYVCVCVCVLCDIYVEFIFLLVVDLFCECLDCFEYNYFFLLIFFTIFFCMIHKLFI